MTMRARTVPRTERKSIAEHLTHRQPQLALRVALRKALNLGDDGRPVGLFPR